MDSRRPDRDLADGRIPPMMSRSAGDRELPPSSSESELSQRARALPFLAGVGLLGSPCPRPRIVQVLQRVSIQHGRLKSACIQGNTDPELRWYCVPTSSPAKGNPAFGVCVGEATCWPSEGEAVSSSSPASPDHASTAPAAATPLLTTPAGRLTCQRSLPPWTMLMWHSPHSMQWGRKHKQRAARPADRVYDLLWSQGQ